jgi:hypothetical protein
MNMTGAVLNDLFDGGRTKPKQNSALIRSVHSGKTDKTTKHGPAKIKRIAGLIHTVENVLLPDGSRTSNIERGMPEHEDWFYQKSNGECVYGHVRVRDDDVVFVPRIDQPKPFMFPANSLPAQLISRTHACELARDEDFALKLYGALCAGAWIQEGRRWQGGWDKAARTVAEMRGLNEPYTKFLLGDADETEVTDADIIDLMESLGWTLESVDPEARRRIRNEKAKRALNLLDECEKEPVSTVPEWYMRRIMALRPGNPKDVLVRINWAAFSGQMTFQSYVKFWELYDLDLLDEEDDD